MINQPLTNNIPDESSVNPDLISLQFKLDAANHRVAVLEQAIISNCYDDFSKSGKSLIALAIKVEE
jgi:hypothetical protein